jgi:flap endonuclease-1
MELLAGKKIAVDALNTLYQFLSIIRGRDGRPLKDFEGRVTSHLSGLLYRNSNLAQAGAKLVYVFDGKPHSFKKGVLEDRRIIRDSAKIKYEKALEEGDVEVARLYGQQAVVATKDIVQDSKTLLSLMGIPWIQSPGEGEAQSAYMARKGDVWGVSSQDFDALLYGSPMLIRNLSISGRRKLPRKNVYIKIEPKLVDLSKNLRTMEISLDQLIDVGLLIGTDYNPKGIKGIGPKTALKLIKKHDTIKEAILHIKNPTFPYPIEEIKELFLNPRITDDYSLEWSKPDASGIVDFLCKKHSFSENRVIKAIEKIEEGYAKKSSESTLDRWFT